MKKLGERVREREREKRVCEREQVFVSEKEGQKVRESVCVTERERG
jgi:hypothetical protein